jgi:hypothetical protein
MKVYIKFACLLFVSTLIFTSCENEPLSPDINLNDPSTSPGDGQNVPESDIVGTWEVTDQTLIITQEINADFEGLPINTTQTITADQISGDATITFSDDGSYTSSGTITLEITGEQDGMPIPGSETTEESGFGSGTWSISNGNLNLSAEGTDVSYVITSFSTNSMVLFTDDELPSFDELLASGEIPDISDLPGFEGLNFEVNQDFELEAVLTKVQ